MPDAPEDIDAPENTGRPRRIVAPIILSAVAIIVVAVVIFLVVRSPGTPVSSPSDSVSTSIAPSSITGAPTPADSTSGSATTTAPTSPAPTSSRPTPTASVTQTSSGQTPQKTKSPVPIRTSASAVIKPGLTAAITKLEAVKGEAQGPGEIAGPAVRFVLTLTNNSDAVLPLGTTVVNVYYGKAETPADELTKPGGKPLPASVSAGGTASGTFVYTIPAEDRGNVLITVDYSVDVSLIAFRGTAPR